MTICGVADRQAAAAGAALAIRDEHQSISWILSATGAADLRRERVLFYDFC
jgi:hypothetical protein